jgi:flagellar biosynthesis/type III secretory pathway protein FliH
MSTEEQQTKTDPLRPPVRTFKPSTFQACEFEVVAMGTSSNEFALERFTVVEGSPLGVDPMFDVYDNLVASEQDFAPEEGSTWVEQSSFVDDISIIESDVQGGTISSDESPSSVVTDEALPREGSDEQTRSEEPVVAASEVELLHQKFEEERRALQAEHERHLEEVKAALQHELSAQYAAESEDKVKSVEERYRTIIDDMGGQIRQEVEAVERRAVEFAVQVARKLVGTIVEINPEYILQVIQEAIKLTGGATIKAIRVGPHDLEFIKMLSPDRQFKEFDGSWSFQADDTIRAGCVVETSSGEVEFDLDKTWDRIKESVIKVR